MALKPEDLQNEVDLEDEGVWIDFEVKPRVWIKARMLSRASDEVQRAHRMATARFQVDLETKREDKDSQARKLRAQICVYLRMLSAATREIRDFELEANRASIFADPPLDPDARDDALRRWGKLRQALSTAWDKWDQQAAEVLAEAGKEPLPPCEGE